MKFEVTKMGAISALNLINGGHITKVASTIKENPTIEDWESEIKSIIFWNESLIRSIKENGFENEF